MRSIARMFLAALVIAGGTFGGMSLGLLAGSDDVQRTSFGTVETSMQPDLHGHVEVYVPLVDWRVRLLKHDAPVAIRMELRGVDRQRAGEGLSSASAAGRSLQTVRSDTELLLERAIRRGAIAAVIGGLAGALLAGALLAGLLLRRRWLLVAPAMGALAIIVVFAASARALSGLGEQRVEVVAAGGHARELPVVLRFAQQLLHAGDEYEEHYQTALESIANVAAFASDEDLPPPDATALLISDLHDNVFVLDALDDFAGDDVVFAAGDFVQVGARVEEATAGRVARLGSKLVAVSGNHDTPQYMRRLREAGAIVLDADTPAEQAAGLVVAGYPDPLERKGDSDGSHRLRVYGAEYERQRADVIEWWEALEERPDAVLLHQHGFAHALVDHLAQRGDKRPLVVFAGHDHEPHVHAGRPHVIVDGGSVGAGGIAAVGEQPASFARLLIRDGRVIGVDLVSVEPLTGRAETERIELVG